VGFKYLKKEAIDKLPKTAGVYAFKKGREILYIGKAANIRERVRQHKELLSKALQLGYLKTDSEIEALILEANLIKKYQPKYNVVWRDDKNYFYVGITKEDYPQVFITHQIKSLNTKYKILNTKFVGPFVDGGALKQTLKILRKVFPYRSCRVLPKRPCLWYHLGRCPAPCLTKSKISLEIPLTRLKKDCQRNAKNIMKIFKRGKTKTLGDLKKEMKTAAKNQNFELAAKIRDQISALEKVMSHARIFEPFQISPIENWSPIQKELKKILKTKKGITRIEAYDISNIQGEVATGAMVTFINGHPDKNFYRKFKINIAGKPDDVAMLKEVLSRRLKHPEWPYPDLMLIDGGKPQLNVAVKSKFQNTKSKNIKIIAIAKQKNELFIEGQKKSILLKSLPREIFNLILQLRDEAHRFAQSYHHKLRKKVLLGD